LPFPFGKGSKAALEGAPREHRGSTGEHGGASREHGGAAREQVQLFVQERAQNKGSLIWLPNIRLKSLMLLISTSSPNLAHCL